MVLFQFVYEGMEESGSEGLDDLLIQQKDKFLKVRLLASCPSINDIERSLTIILSILLLDLTHCVSFCGENIVCGNH